MMQKSLINRLKIASFIASLSIIFGFIWINVNAQASNGQGRTVNQINLFVDEMATKLARSAQGQNVTISSDDKKRLQYIIALYRDGSFNASDKASNLGTSFFEENYADFPEDKKIKHNWNSIYNFEYMVDLRYLTDSNDPFSFLANIDYTTHARATPSRKIIQIVDSSIKLEVAGKDAHISDKTIAHLAVINPKLPSAKTMATNTINFCTKGHAKFNEARCRQIIDQIFEKWSKMQHNVARSNALSAIEAAGINPDNWPLPNYAWPEMTDQQAEDAANTGEAREKEVNKLDSSGEIVDNTPILGSAKEPNYVPCRMAGGMAFALCPLVEWIERTTTGSYEGLKNWLPVSQDVISEPAVQRAWNTFYRTAMIGLVVAMLVMIIATMTGQLLSNYTIKKMLPRYFIFLVLVTISFPVVRMMIEISNVVGQNLFELLQSWGDLMPNAGKFIQIKKEFDSALIKAGSGAMTAALMMVELVFFAIMVIIVGILWIASYLSLLVILSIRAALAILMIVFAPIGLVSMIFPNTKKIASYWFNGLMSVLIIYPIAALACGGGYLAYNVIPKNTGHILGMVVPWSALITPIILIPFLAFKKLTAIVVAGGVIASANRLAGRFARNRVNKSQTLQAMRQRSQVARLQQQAGIYKGINPFRRAASLANRGLMRVMPGAVDVATQSSQNLETKRQEMVKGINQSVLEAKMQDGASRGAAYDKLSSFDKAQYNMLGSYNQREVILASIEQYAINVKLQDQPTDAEFIVQGLEQAKKAGASQLQLASVYEKTKQQLLESNNLSAIVDLEAHTKFNDGKLGRSAKILSSGNANFEELRREEARRLLSKEISLHQFKAGEKERTHFRIRVNDLNNPVVSDVIDEKLRDKNSEFYSTVSNNLDLFDPATREEIAKRL